MHAQRSNELGLITVILQVLIDYKGKKMVSKVFQEYPKVILMYYFIEIASKNF